MSGQHRAAGLQTSTITISGRTYTLRPLTVGAYAQFEDWVVSQKGDPIAALAKVIDQIPAAHRDQAWEAAITAAQKARIVTTAEMAAAENSLHGIAWKLWKCLEQDHPEVNSVDAALQLLIAAGQQRADEIKAALRVASGEEDLKNSSGQAVGAEAETDKTPLAGQ